MAFPAMKRPISFTSASLSRKVAAPITPSTCAAVRTPTMAAVTAGCRSVQAIATSPGRAAVPRADLAQEFRQPEIPREPRLLEVRCIASKIVFRKLGDALPRHLAAQQPGLHGRVDDHADVVRLAVREGLLLRSPARGSNTAAAEKSRGRSSARAPTAAR